MAIGLYRMQGNPNYVQVLYDKNSMPMSEADYRDRGYQPPFEALPWEKEYKEQQNNANGTKGPETPS